MGMFPVPASAFWKPKHRFRKGFQCPVTPIEHDPAHPSLASFLRRKPGGIVFARISVTYAHSIHIKNPRITPYYKEHTEFLSAGISKGYECMLRAYARPNNNGREFGDVRAEGCMTGARLVCIRSPLRGV